MTGSPRPGPSLSGAFAELLGDGAFTGTSLPLLAMGRDVPDGHVHEPGGTDAEVLGTGAAHLGATDLARLLTTFRTTGPHGTAALTRFGRFFAGELWNVYALRHP